MSSTISFVLAGQKGAGKSSIYSQFSPQATGSTKSGNRQSAPIPMTLFSIVTIDFPSVIMQRDTLPQYISTANVIIYVMKDPKDEYLQQFKSLLTSCGLDNSNSTGGEVRMYVLFHQIDRIDKEKQSDSIQEAVDTARNAGIEENHVFATSLFDGSLKRSFSKIISDFIPSYNQLEKCVNNLARSFQFMDQPCHVVIVDAATFLPIFDNDPEKDEQLQPIYDFFINSYSPENQMKTLTFESNSAVVVYTTLSKTTGIFVSSTNEESITTDAILFNIQRAIPTLRDLVKPSF